MQKLRNDGGSGLVTIPKKYLERDGLFTEYEGLPDEHRLIVDRLWRRTYLVRLTDDGSFQELHDCEEIQRVAAQKVLEQDAFGKKAKAD